MKWTLCVALGISVAGCTGNAPESVGRSGRQAEYRALGKKFAEAARDGDWQAAYELCSASFKASHGPADLHSEYDQLLAEIRKDDPQFTPNSADSDIGELPNNEEEAKAGYNIPNPPPRNQWHALVFAEVGNKVPGEDVFERGVEGQMLVIDDGSGLKIASIDWGFMD